MEPYISYLFVGLAGGSFGVLLPYIFKVVQDPNITFDYAYFWSLILSTCVAVTAFIPKNIPFDIVTAITVFFACVGVTVPANKTIKEFRNAEAERRRGNATPKKK
jgi:hypothetical protein